MEYGHAILDKGMLCVKNVWPNSVTPQEARHEEIKERPQLQHIVLDWCPAQDETMLRYDALCSLQHQTCNGAALKKSASMSLQLSYHELASSTLGQPSY